MKENWNRLWSLIKPGSYDERFKESVLNNIFLRHHKRADEIIYCKRTKKPMAAVYYTPLGSHGQEATKIMAMLRKGMEWWGTE
jgi:hypothetical protein